MVKFINVEETDIDRLHNVIEGKVYGRGVGKTYAQLCEMMGILGVTKENITMVVSELRSCDYIIPMMRDVLGNQGWMIEEKKRGSEGPELYVRDIEETGEVRRIRFISRRNAQRNQLRGVREAVVYIYDYD